MKGRNKKFRFKWAFIVLIACVFIIAVLPWLFSFLIKGNYYINQLCQIKSVSAQDATESHSYHLNTFRDKMPSWAVETLYYQSLCRITSSTKVTPLFYEYDDVLGWPRLKVIWQMDQYYLAVKVSMSNDSDNIYWQALSGQYDPAIEKTSAKLVSEEEVDLPIRKK